MRMTFEDTLTLVDEGTGREYNVRLDVIGCQVELVMLDPRMPRGEGAVLRLEAHDGQLKTIIWDQIGLMAEAIGEAECAPESRVWWDPAVDVPPGDIAARDTL